MTHRVIDDFALSSPIRAYERGAVLYDWLIANSFCHIVCDDPHLVLSLSYSEENVLYVNFAFLADGKSPSIAVGKRYLSELKSFLQERFPLARKLWAEVRRIDRPALYLRYCRSCGFQTDPDTMTIWIDL